MSERKSWELTPEQEIKINIKIKEERNTMQDLYHYNKYVMQQVGEFVKIMEFVNNVVNDLIDEREITEFSEVRARVKSQKSVLKNDPIKAVDDVFGIEVITATEPEYEKIIKELKRYMSIQKEKNHDKKNGYKAKHLTMTLKKEYLEDIKISKENYEQVPMIEYQFKTIEVLIKSLTGEAAHTMYKGEELEEVQKKYDSGMYEDGENGIFELPIMWRSKQRKMEILNTEEVLKAMYPYLKIKTKNIETEKER